MAVIRFHSQIISDTDCIVHLIILYYLMCRIPLPELKDSDKLDKIMYMKEATKRLRLGPETLPSICFYTFLNAYQVGSC